MADIKDKSTTLAEDASCGVDDSDRPKPEPWSEEREHRCDEWMESFIGAVEMPFEIDVQEYVEKYGEE
jgi:hypothetical protein